jgi:hypothetical protein
VGVRQNHSPAKGSQRYQPGIALIHLGHGAIGFNQLLEMILMASAQKKNIKFYLLEALITQIY